MDSIGINYYRLYIMLATGIWLASLLLTGCSENRPIKYATDPEEFKKQTVVPLKNNAVVKVLSLLDPENKIHNEVYTRDEMAGPLSRDPQYSSGYAVHIGNGIYLTAAHSLRNPQKFISIDTGRSETFFPVMDYMVLGKSDLAVFRSIIIELSHPLYYETPSIFISPVRISSRDEYLSGKISAVRREGDTILILTEPYGRPGMSGSPLLDEKGSVIAVLVGNIIMNFGESQIKVYGNNISVYPFLKQIKSFSDSVKKNKN